MRDRNNRRHAGANAGSRAKAREQLYTVEEQGDLLPFLIRSLHKLSRNSVKTILASKQVRVNGQVTTAYNESLSPGDKVTIDQPDAARAPRLVGLDILHEDDHLIVVRKEAGLLSIATGDEHELTVYRQLMDYVRAESANNRVFIVHRLDRDTSGVMVLAKNEEAQQTLQNNWQEAVVERTYVALVEGTVRKDHDTIVSWLKESRTLIMYSSSRPNDGQQAITHYKTLQRARQYSLLEVQLQTGRKNQIRVHMKDIGHPVVGDKKYGSRSNPIGRLGLHARVLAFHHPSTGDLLRFETAIPTSFFKPLK